MADDGPRRRFTILVSVGGDTWADALRELVGLVEHIEEHGPECSSTRGGPDSGGYVYVTEDPEQTHDRYFEQIEEWRAKREPVG